MMKQVIFNVGGALSVYTEFAGKKIVNDLGKSDDFDPVTQFLVPLFKKRGVQKVNNKYPIDQLIISHPHKDHISAIEDFDKNFHPGLLTCPSDVTKRDDDETTPDDEKINWGLIGNEEDDSIITLKEMLDGRALPLRPTVGDNKQILYWLPPGVVGNDPELHPAGKDNWYANNISIATLFRIGAHLVFLPGDLQKEAMAKLLTESYHDRETLSAGLSTRKLRVLVAPHHGLVSSFSNELFDAMVGKKTKCLNVISEKVYSEDDAREIASQYSNGDFCCGDNDLESTNGTEKNYQYKTSRGHLCIDYSNGDGDPHFEIITDPDELVEWFVED